MNRRPLVRALLASAAIAAAVALAGCDTETGGLGGAPSSRSLAPLSDRMLQDLAAKNMAKELPILVRLFKEEAELEVWKEDATGQMALLKTYPICRWSGELGPKIKEGDRQAPEGFYMITPSLMNPNSNYYLAINMGFPNSYDRANGRTGDFLMIHGDCSSRGCYAMTDEQIAEIYALARESFFGGQRAFQIQAMPFKMTPLNMAKHRNSPNMAFWRMLKQGYDAFEVTRHEPKVDVCEKHYVFNAEPASGSATPLRFSAAGKCPAYSTPADIVAAVQEKQQQDERQMATLVSRGTETVPVRTGTDGGMNPVFLAAVKPDMGGSLVRAFSAKPLPGTIPPGTRPPGEQYAIGETIAPAATGSTFSLASAESKPAPAPNAAPAQSSSGGGFFGGLFSSIGLGGSQKAPEPPPPAASIPKPKPAAKLAPTAIATARPKAEPQQTAAKTNAGAIRPQTQEASAAPQATTGSVLNGAQPTVPSGGFENRFGAWR